MEALLKKLNLNANDKKAYFRQGDILFVKIPDMAERKDMEVIKEDNNGGGDYRKVVAYGEATGHHHSFSGQDQVLLYRKKGSNSAEPEMVEVQSKKGALLQHQEHKDFVLPQGLYRIRKEVEYNPILEQMQKVRD